MEVTIRRNATGGLGVFLHVHMGAGTICLGPGWAPSAPDVSVNSTQPNLIRYSWYDGQARRVLSVELFSLITDISSGALSFEITGRNTGEALVKVLSGEWPITPEMGAITLADLAAYYAEAVPHVA